jgi:DNA-binding FadR family transcriptional regulator
MSGEIVFLRPGLKPGARMAIAQLKTWLEEAELPADGRLPAERELADTLGLSRAELRKSLAILEAEGMIWRHVGKGTFLAGPQQRQKADMSSLAHRTSPPEAMQARMIIEPEVAALAARQATGAQIQHLRALCVQMRSASGWPEYQQLDGDFHAALATSTGNSLLAELHAIVNDVRRSVVWGGLAKRTLGPPKDYHSFAEHEMIVTAIENRDRQGAAEAMRRHLSSTYQDLIGDQPLAR